MCVDGQDQAHRMCLLSCLAIKMKCACRVRACPVGWGRPGPVFGPVVKHVVDIEKLYIHVTKTVVLRLLHLYRITLGSNKHNRNDAP